jgi:UrcA family protein
MKSRNAAYAVIAALSLTATAPALATSRVPVSVTVSTAGLDLASPDGMARAKFRAFNAVRDACTPEVWGIRGDRPDMRCIAEMRQDAIAKLTERAHGAPSVQFEAVNSGGF